jgi:hypothetical protein
MEKSRKMIKRFILLLAMLSPLAAHADPVTAAIAAFAAFATTTAGVIAITATVLSVGMAVYGSAQARRAERDAKNARNAAMQDRMATRIAGDSPHRYIYGEAKVGSDIVAMFSSGAKDEYKHIVCVLAAHECESVEEVYINNVAVGLLNSSGDATTGRFAPIPGTEVFQESKTGPTFTLSKMPVGPVQAFTMNGIHMTQVAVTAQSGRNITIASSGTVIVNYQYAVGRKFGEITDETATVASAPYVRVQIHLGGATDPADAYLMSVVPDKWTSTSVLRGLCYLVVTLDLNNPEFQNGQVPIQALVRGRKLYDPRTGLTQWSANPALAVRDYLTSPLCGVPASDIPAAQIITAANVCDELVVAGGPRYTINGSVTSAEAQAGVLEAMAQCMAGSIVSTTWEIQAGKYVAPVAALLQSDIVGAISISPGASDATIYNGVKGQYLSDENGYVLTDFKPYQNAAYLEADGRDLYTNIDFPFTNTLQRVTNLARIFTEDHRNDFTIKAEFSLKAWPRKVGERITFTSSYWGQSARVFRITDKSFAPNSAVELTLKEDAASIWDFADAVTVDSTPNTDLPDPWAIAPLASLTCTSGVSTLLTQADGSIVPRILVTWPVATTQSVFTNGEIEIEWRAISTDTWQKTKISGHDTQAYLSPITPGFFYAVRARTVNPYLNVKSDWIMVTYQVAVFTATATVYKWAADMPAMPSGADSWTWSTSTFAAPPSGWSSTEPAAPTGGDSTLWTADVLVSDISATGSTVFNWNTASISARGYAASPTGAGPAGYSNARVFAYQRAASAPTGSPGTVDYDFTTGTITTATLANGWLKTIPAANGNPLYVTAASASAAGAADTIASGEWSGAVVLAQDGTAGAPGLNSATVTIYQRAATATAPALPSASTTYTFATGVLTGLNNGWTQYIPSSGGAYLHTSLATAAATTTTDAIASSEWAAATLMYDAAALIAAQAAADAANAALANIASNNILSPSEKPAVVQDYTDITNEKAGIDSLATYYGVIAAKNDYDTAVTALTTHLGTLPGWNTIPGSDITIVGTTFYSKFADVRANRQVLLNAISTAAGNTSTWTGTSSRPANLASLSGSENILNSLITLGADGAIGGGATGQATLSGMGLKNWRAVAVGGVATTNPVAGGLYLAGSMMQAPATRGFVVVLIDRATNAIYDHLTFDVYGAGATSGGRDAGTMAGYLNAISGNYIVVVLSSDEPEGNRLTAGLPAAMYRHGASRACFGSPEFKYRSAYLLIGIANCGEGNGAEAYQGAVANDTNAWCDLGFYLLNGNLIVSGSSFTPKTLADYSYTGDLNASYGAPSGSMVGGTEAGLLASRAANGDAAYNGINDATTGLAQRLRANAANVLAGGAGLTAGTLTYNSSGVRTGGYGVAINSAGIVGFNSAGTPTISINASTGAVAVAGDISGSTGTFYGNLSAVGGTFTGALSAATGTFTGALSGVSGTFSGTLTAAQVITTDNIINDGITTVDSFPSGISRTGTTQAAFAVSRASKVLVICACKTLNGKTGGFGIVNSTTSTTVLQEFTTVGGSRIRAFDATVGNYYVGFNSGTFDTDTDVENIYIIKIAK